MIFLAPFLYIYWENVLVYKSEVVKGTQDPKFDPFVLHFSQIGGPNGILKIKCWDFNETGTHDLIGEVDVEVKNNIFINRMNFNFFNYFLYIYYIFIFNFLIFFIPFIITL